MSKATRIALLGLLGVALVAGSASAGPGGRNGDPDHPQIANPVGPLYKAEQIGPGNASVSASSERPMPEMWQRVVRMYLRMHGVRIR